MLSIAAFEFVACIAGAALGADEASVAVAPQRAEVASGACCAGCGSPERYNTVSDEVWTGAGHLGDPDLALPAHLTYSFPDDGALWGDDGDSVWRRYPNSLVSALAAEFGFDALDLGREHIRQALGAWAKFTGLTYSESADDNGPLDETTGYTPAPSGGPGEIRIGGVRMSTSFGFNGFPSDEGAPGFGGGDTTLNSALFDTDNGWEQDYYSFIGYLVLRNTMIHEHGHGIGLGHTQNYDPPTIMTPPSLTEPDIEESAVFVLLGLQVDDIRGGMRHYGDRFAGNHSRSLSVDLGDAAASGVLFEPWLSMNGDSDATDGHDDWFHFTIDAQSDVEITVAPTGVTYGAGINALEAGDLGFEVENASQNSLALVDDEGPGEPESVTLQSLPAGKYYVRVFDAGASGAATNLFVQTYDLEVRTDAEAKRRPFAFAGVDKRIVAGERCFFIGDINSFTTEPGASIVSYDWDLDGDTIVDAADEPRPEITYTTTGSREVTLFVTDSNAKVASHSITVDVVDPYPLLLGVDAARVRVGRDVSPTIVGRELTAVSSVEVGAFDAGNQFQFVADAEVDVTGSPSVSMDGSEITGFMIEASCDATPGRRSIRVVADSVEYFLVEAFVVAPLAGDFNDDCAIDFSDLNLLLGAIPTDCTYQGPCCSVIDPNCDLKQTCTYCGSCPYDLNDDCMVDEDDLKIFLNLYGA